MSGALKKEKKTNVLPVFLCLSHIRLFFSFSCKPRANDYTHTHTHTHTAAHLAQGYILP